MVARKPPRRGRAAGGGGHHKEPSYELAERDGDGGRELFLRVSLPTTDSLAAAELDVSSDGIGCRRRVPARASVAVGHRRRRSKANFEEGEGAAGERAARVVDLGVRLE